VTAVCLFGGGGGRGTGGGGGERFNRIGLGLIVAVAVGLCCCPVSTSLTRAERGVELKFWQEERSHRTRPALALAVAHRARRKGECRPGVKLSIGRRGDKGSGGGVDSGFMLTEDENIVVVEFTVQYKIKDASDYLFQCADPKSTIVQAMSRQPRGRRQEPARLHHHRRSA